LAPKKTRRFGTKITSHPDGKREYMREYMVQYRRAEREMIQAYKKMLRNKKREVKDSWVK